MRPYKYKVADYKTVRGTLPVREFVEKQGKATRSKVDRFVIMLRIYGPDLGMPYARYLGKGLYELRVRGKNEVRVFYIALATKDTVMLLHAFNKRTQKLPARELATARRRQKELTSL